MTPTIAPAPSLQPKQILYPETDGLPMAENTEQFSWIVIIKEGLEWLFANRVDVFVAGDLFWYPVEGDNKTRQAPDTMVVFGRPKGKRSSYLQWNEGNIPPQVVFEIMSPGNTFAEMMRKFRFYERYGVEEYYVYDPERHNLEGWIRQGNALVEIPSMQGWQSPRLGVQLSLNADGELVLIRPDGKPFISFVEMARQAERAERLAAQLRALGVEPEA